MADIKELQKQLENLTAENKKLKTDLDNVAAVVESLKEENADLKSDNAALVSTINDLQTSSTELTIKNNELIVANELLASDNAALQAEVKKLLETPDEKEKESGVGNTFEHASGTFEVLVPSVTVPGFGKLTAIDLLADPKAQAALVATGSSVIKKVK